MQLSPDVILGTSLGFLAASMWAISVVVYRSQSDEIRPLAIGSVKMWVAFGFMALLVTLPWRPNAFSVPVESIIYLALSTTLGAVAGDTILFMSQERIGVSYSFPIAMSFPVLTYILAILFLDDEVSAMRFFGTIIAVVGLIIISREQNNEEDDDGNSHFDLLGIGMALFTMVCYSVGTVLLDIGVTGVDPIDANFVRVFIGSIEFIPIYIVASQMGMPKPTRRATKIVAAAGFFGMALGSLLYVAMVKYIGAAMGSVIGSTSPLFAVPVSMIFLKERPTRTALFGIIIAISGVILVVGVL
ncbi:MAG: DMT family transporter [Candidatus Thorarchaeota archaeon]|jgi:drug/metabolite transporter (DMT)-like permease